jgi:hypothetical protein
MFDGVQFLFAVAYSKYLFAIYLWGTIAQVLAGQADYSLQFMVLNY